MKNKFLWIAAVVIVVTLAIVAFVFFRNTGQVYEETQRTSEIFIDTNKTPSATNGKVLPTQSDRTYGNIFPYLAAPHEK